MVPSAAAAAAFPHPPKMYTSPSTLAAACPSRGLGWGPSGFNLIHVLEAAISRKKQAHNLCHCSLQWVGCRVVLQVL